MAQIIINIPDAVMPRVRAAFGLDTTPATISEVIQILRNVIRQRVITHEKAKAIEEENWN